MKNKILSSLQPKYVIAISFTVAVLMIVAAYIEFNQSKKEILVLMQKEAYSLAEAIEQSSEIIVNSTEEIEYNINERLLNNAYYVAYLDSLGQLNRNRLKRICSENNLFSIKIYNKNKNLILSNLSLDKNISSQFILPENIYNSILNDDTNKKIIGVLESEENTYNVGIRRTNSDSGVILITVHIESINKLRHSVGIGKFMKNIGDNKGIEYAVLQDTVGIIAANSSVKEVTSIREDEILKVVLNKDTTITRIISINDKKVYEVVRPLHIDEELFGIIRIGLSMDEINSIEMRVKQRVIIIFIIVCVLVVLSIMTIIANQNVVISQKRIQTIETFTGNILENMHDAMIAITNDGKITIFNKQSEKLFGLESSKIIGKSLIELSNSYIKDVFVEENNNKELSIKNSITNIEHIISINITHLDNNIISVIRDITENKYLQEEINRKEKLIAIGKLAAGVAHEIRNPLNAISMIAQRYEKEFVPRKALKEYKTLTKVLKKESERVNNTVQQFLNYARPPKLIMTTFPVSQLFNHVSALFKSMADEKHINFISSCNYNGTIIGDINAITQALFNVLQNALEATPENGTIYFSAYSKNSNLVLEIEDTGKGISPDNIENIFNLYYTTKSSGSGIGLAITHQIISQHYGSIQVKSNIGSGTLFKIFFPLKHKN